MQMSVPRLAMRLQLIALFSLPAFFAASGGAIAATGFTTLHDFTGRPDGANPYAGLIMDSAGDLFGTTNGGGVQSGSTVFESPKTATGYGTPVTLVSFDGNEGAYPYGRLIADAAGDLFGTTAGGGANNVGTVFELSGAGTPLSKNPQTADFNADRKSDILWQNASGQAQIWLMSGRTPTAKALVGPNPGPSWQVIGTGDFYGSLYSDILWQNLSGAVARWEINGTTVIDSTVIGNLGPSWHAIGTGDFNGDGYSDILWQNTNGEVAIWEMNGTKVIGRYSLGNPGLSWHVIGTGDFNGDGYADIQFQNTNGTVTIWEMNGNKVIGSVSLGNPGSSWHVIGSGDFNGDGYADILWQNTSGEVSIWEINGTNVIARFSLGAPGPSWHIIGSGDFNGDG